MCMIKRSKRLLRNFLKDIKYGGRFLGGGVPSKYEHCYNMANSDYDILSAIFKIANIKKSNIVVDVGCGKGRVINWLLDNNFENKIYGIEIDEKIAEETKNRLKHYKNVEIITGKAELNIPSDGEVFYLYNPFDEIILGQFISKIINMFYRKKEIIIIYYNPAHLDILKNNKKLDVKYFDIKQYMKKMDTANTQNFAIIKFKNNSFLNFLNSS